MKPCKRILSILLTALLLALALGPFTAAQAAVSCNGNHEWSGWQGIGATCDTAGFQERRCYRCGTVDRQTIPALGHSWNGGAVTAQPSCTSGGTRVYTCTRCGATRTEGIGALGHSYGGVQVTKPSTCATMGESYQVCSRCGDRVTHVMPKNENHSWDEGVITKEPEGFTPGEKTYTCTLCGATRTEEVEPVTGLFSNLNSLLSGGNLRNNIMSNPLGDDILHIVEQPQGGSIPHGGYTVLHVAAEGGVEPYTYEWWYEPTGLLGAGVSPSALADLINGQGQAAAATIQQNRNDVKNATIVSTAEWLSKHISNADTTTQHTDMTAMETEPPETKPFNPLAKCMGSSASPECSAWTAGSYWCIVYDSAGHHVTSEKANVMDALYIAVQPESKNIFGTGSATLTCKAGGGSGNYVYTWYDEENIPLSNETAFPVNQEGTYYCTVADYDTLEVVDSDKVQIYSDEATQKDLRPVITLQPSDVTLEYHEDGEYSSELICHAQTFDGGSENLKYEWERKCSWVWVPWGDGEVLSTATSNASFRCKVTDTRTGQYVHSNAAKVQIELQCTITAYNPSWGADGTATYEIRGGKGPYLVKLYKYQVTGLDQDTHDYQMEWIYSDSEHVDSEGQHTLKVFDAIYPYPAFSGDKIKIYWGESKIYIKVTDDLGNTCESNQVLCE